MENWIILVELNAQHSHKRQFDQSRKRAKGDQALL